MEAVFKGVFCSLRGRFDREIKRLQLALQAEYSWISEGKKGEERKQRLVSEGDAFTEEKLFLSPLMEKGSGYGGVM